MENIITITTAEYAELIEAKIMLKAIERIYKEREYVSESYVREITGWKEPSEKEVDVPDVFTKCAEAVANDEEADNVDAG